MTGDIYTVDKYSGGGFKYRWAVYKAPYKFKDAMGSEKGQVVERFRKKSEASSRASELVNNNPQARGRLEVKFAKTRPVIDGFKVVGRSRGSGPEGGEVILFTRRRERGPYSSFDGPRYQPALTVSYMTGSGEFILQGSGEMLEAAAQEMVNKMGFNGIKRYKSWDKRVTRSPSF